jgi:hypothetical protein
MRKFEDNAKYKKDYFRVSCYQWMLCFQRPFNTTIKTFFFILQKIQIHS